jgi:GGDEF domain-containing protein
MLDLEEQDRIADRPGDAALALELGSAAVAGVGPRDDPLFPVAVLRGRRDLGLDADEGALLRRWEPGLTRETGSIRYRWAINPRFAGDGYGDRYPAWIGPIDSWRPWRMRDIRAWAERRERGVEEIERLITPLVLTDALDLLAGASRRTDAIGSLARSFLDEALPKVRRDAATWVLEIRAWADTWALWSMARRPGALGLLHPFATAIAGSYAASAGRADGVVLGTRFPYHQVPLVSGSAQLAAGLVALGVHPNLTGVLAAWVRREQRPTGGWGDGDGDPDLLTTLVAAELLAALDPGYEPAATARWFAGQQRPDGWWRACGPETTWLTVEILAWLRRAELPFAARFTWPQLAIANRDRRTGLPFYGYFADLERLFAGVEGLRDAPIDVAFIDLAGFGSFNNAHGMAMGDRVLRTFAQALARIPEAMAVRDGGDEFIVLGPPTGTGLPGRMAAFREVWASEFATTYGQGLVAPRILTITTSGGRIVDARDELGIRIAQLKEEVKDVGPLGIQRDLGSAAVPVQDRARIVADPRSAHGDRSAEGPTL